MKYVVIPMAALVVFAGFCGLDTLYRAIHPQAHKPAVPPEIERGPVNVVVTNPFQAHWIAIGMRTAMVQAPFTNVVLLGRDLEPTTNNELSIRYSDGTVFRMPLKATVDKGW